MDEKTNFRSYFLTFDDGPRLEIMNKPDMEDPEKTLNRTGLIHIAFSVGSKEKVNALHRFRMRRFRSTMSRSSRDAGTTVIFITRTRAAVRC